MMDTPMRIREELRGLQDDLRAAGIDIEPITDLTSPAGLQRLRAGIRKAIEEQQRQCESRRRQAEEEAQTERESRRMLQLVLDAMPIRVFWKDRDLSYMGGNLLLAHDTGYASPEDLIGKTDYDTASRETAELYRADDRAVMESGVAKIGYEEPQIAADGSRVWLYTSKIPLRNPDGDIIGVLGLYEDITPRKRIEEELRTSQERLAKIFETAIVGLVVHAPDGTVVQCNATACELLGVASEDLCGTSFGKDRSFIYEDGSRIPLDEYPEYSIPRTKQPVRNVVTGIHLPGTPEIRWLLVNAVPLCDEQENVTEVIVSFIDITERKRIEHEREDLLDEVNRRAAELDATIAAMADGVIIYDTGMRIQRMSAGAERILGYTGAEATGPLAERLSKAHFRTMEGVPILPDEYPAVRALSGETVRGEIYSMTRRDGYLFWVSLSAAPIRQGDTIIGAVMTFADITAFHQLQQRQVELLHIVSHDLRLPLTVINGHAQLIEEILSERHIDGELALSISTIMRSSQRMNLMIQDLVDLARLEGKQIVLQCEPVVLDQYLPDLLRRLADVIPAHRVRLSLNPNLPPVWADPARLERIFLNLLSNALKYSAPTSPVEISATRKDDQQVVISVTDHGQGIAPEDLPHIFERFYQVKGGRKPEGVGLGLYITKMLVEAHGGQIWVDSTPNLGSTFSFTLPISPAEE